MKQTVLLNFKLLKKKNNQKGFTLVELLIYMGILSVLIGILSVLLGAILDIQMDASSTSSVDQDARFIQGRMTYDVQRASIIDTPTSNTLELEIGPDTYTYTVDGSGNITLNNGTSTEQLNSEDITVSGVMFQIIGSGSENDTVRVTYTVTSDVQEKSGQESRTVQTTLGLQ